MDPDQIIQFRLDGALAASRLALHDLHTLSRDYADEIERMGHRARFDADGLRRAAHRAEDALRELALLRSIQEALL